MKDYITEKDKKISYKFFKSCIKKCKPSLLLFKGGTLKQMIELVFRENSKDEKQNKENVFDTWLKTNNIAYQVIPYSLYEKASMNDQFFLQQEYEHGGKIPKSIKAKYANYVDEKTKLFLKNELNVSGSFNLYELRDQMKECLSKIFKCMDFFQQDVYYKLNDSLVRIGNGEDYFPVEELRETVFSALNVCEEVERNKREIFRLMDGLNNQIDFIWKSNFKSKKENGKQKEHLEKARGVKKEEMLRRKMLLDETGGNEKKLNELLQYIKDSNQSYDMFFDLVRRNSERR